MHIVHLLAKHIVQVFSETGLVMESDIPMDASLVGIDEDLETEYMSGDTFGKLWAFINQVRLSPQASAFFFQCCVEEGLPHLELIKYVQTHWSSMYDLLERAFKLKPVSSYFHLQPLIIHERSGHHEVHQSC